MTFFEALAQQIEMGWTAQQAQDAFAAALENRQAIHHVALPAIVRPEYRVRTGLVNTPKHQAQLRELRKRFPARRAT